MAKSEKSPFLQIRNFNHEELVVDFLSVKSSESWCLYGSNSSGVEILLQLLQQTLTKYSADEVLLPPSLGVITFKGQQELYEAEMRNDETDFLGFLDPGTLVKTFLPDYKKHEKLLKTFAMEQCLDLGYRQLSSGQSRKVLILQHLLHNHKFLVIQNPYDGLDVASCEELNRILGNLHEYGVSVLIFVTVARDIPGWCDNLAVIEKGHLYSNPSDVPASLRAVSEGKIGNDFDKLKNELTEIVPNIRDEKKEELVILTDGFAAYPGCPLFSNLNLSICSGDHTLICGPNGCGKSTLLDIITGDNQDCYVNNLRIFGQKRGTGESIWEIKKKMGIVSPGIHRNHRSVGTALHVVLSGLFDSIGLYRKVHRPQIATAQKWLSWLGMSGKDKTPFSYLSFAEQRLVLIARALIKKPKLLILDEPTQGLDDTNRERLFQFLELIVEKQLATILYVSHRTDEHRSFFATKIQLDSYQDLSYCNQNK